MAAGRQSGVQAGNPRVGWPGHADMPRYCWTLLAGWLCFLAGAGEVHAEASIPFTIASWKSDTITPQNAVLTAVITITQTRDGYLWLGTLDGLLRFDGVHFTSFNEANTPGLKSGSVVKVFEDSRTNLWIGTENGDILRVKEGKVEPVQVGRGTRESRLMAICEDKTGAVWLYTADGTLAQYRAGKIETWQVLPNTQGHRLLASDNSGTVWVGTDSLLYQVVPSGGRAEGDVPAIAYSKASVSRLDYLLASRDGGCWRLADGHIQKWTGNQMQAGCDWPYPWSTATTPVRAACEDQQGHLVVGTGGEGVFWFNSQGQPTHLTDSNGLSSTNILSLCMDYQGDLWVGTDGSGLNRVRRKVFDVLEPSRGLTVQSVCPDGADGLWIGYFGPLIDHWTQGGIERFRGKDQGLADLGVKSVFLDDDRNLWVGTLLGGLLEFQPGQTKTFAPARGAEPIGPRFGVSEISALYQDSRHRLWAGTQAGLASFRDGTWSLAGNAAAGEVVRAILEDHSGNLWVGTQGAGLKQMRDGKVTVYGRAEGLPGENISCLLEDHSGVLWAGTSVGLARFDGRRWISYAGHFRGATGSIGYLIDDDQGSLWMGSSVGLLRARLTDLQAFAAGQVDSVPVRSFGQPDGLPTRVCSQGSQPAASRTPDGKLWFPTISGLVSVDPKQLLPNTNPPPVIIESVWVDGRPQGPDTLRAPVPQSLVIPASRESLEIHYTSINLPAPDLGLFQYRLTGHEKDWTTTESQQRFAHFTRLPHGHYTFEVRACNEDGVWSGAPAMLAVTVLPPFWETWWFLSVSSLCLLAAIVGSVHYVSTQKLQREVAALRQHELLELERARIARDLHDQLGANLTQVALLGEMAETDKELPQEVEAHARQISQTARETTRALDEIVWTVNPSNDTLDGLINYVCKYAQEFLAMAGLRYRLEVPSQLPSIPISPELRHNVFLAAKESVNNVVKHSHATAAWLRLRLEADRFTLEIEDNGTGLPTGADQKGRNGLRNMRKRLEEIGGAFGIAPGQEGGTRVSLTAPLAAQRKEEE